MIETFNGNCIDVMDKMISEGKTVDYVFTSPPYNSGSSNMYKGNINDNKTNEEYRNLLYGFTDRCLKLCPNGFVIVNIQELNNNYKDVFDYIAHYNGTITSTFIWNKLNPTPVTSKDGNKHYVTSSFEYFFILNNNGKRIRSNHHYTKNIITTIIASNEYHKIHGATMNSDVADWFIENFTDKGSTVLDPFMGLGTTGISCMKFERNFIGIEMTKQYFDIANKRIKDTEKSTKNNLSSLFS